MTRYILHGGNTSKECQSNRDWYARFTEGEKSLRTILMCMWARDPKKAEEVIRRDQKRIQEYAQEKVRIQYLIPETPEEFLQQVPGADVVYFSAGEYPETLLKKMKKVTELGHHLDNRLVMASSAGTFLLTEHSINSFTTQPQNIHTGMGVLPFNVLCHADIDDQLELKIDLIKQKSDKPILLLNEGEYTTFIH